MSSLKSRVTASSLRLMTAILSSLPMMKLTFFKTGTPSTDLQRSVTKSLSLPGSRAALKPTQG